MSLKEKISYARKFSARMIIRKVFSILQNFITKTGQQKIYQKKDLRHVSNLDLKVSSLIHLPKDPNSLDPSDIPNALGHIFNILGTGPISASYNMSPSGFEGTKFEQRLTLNNFDKQGT